MGAGDGAREGAGAMVAWQEKRDWGDIFATNRAREIQAKLLSPERQKLTPLEAKRRAEEKQARARLFRKERSRALAERLAKADESRQEKRAQLSEQLEKKIQDMDNKLQRGRELRDRHIAAIADKAKSENIKVVEIMNSASLEAEDKRNALHQRMQETEARRQEILAAVVMKQKLAEAAIEEAQERKQRIESERQKRLVCEQQRKARIRLKLTQERERAAEAREALAEQQRVAAEENLRLEKEEAILKRKRITDRLKEAQRRRASYLRQIRDKATISKSDGDRRDSGSFQREAVSSPSGLTPTKERKIPDSPKGTKEDGKRESDYLNMHLEGFTQALKGFQGGGREGREGKEGGEGGEGVGAETKHDDPARKRFKKVVTDLRKHASKNNVAATHSTCGDTIHHIESGPPSYLNLVRECGLIDYIVDTFSKEQAESWPGRTKLLLLRLLQVLTCNSRDNALYLLEKNYFLNIVDLLSKYFEETDCFSAGTFFSTAIDLLLPVVSEVIVAARHGANDATLHGTMVGFFSCSGLMHQIRDSFSLFDPSKIKDNKIPKSVDSCLRMLDNLTASREEREVSLGRSRRLSESSKCLIAAFKDTSMIGLPSLLTTVLLHQPQANVGEIDARTFPKNFTSIAYLVVKILNNIAIHDLSSLVSQQTNKQTSEQAGQHAAQEDGPQPNPTIRMRPIPPPPWLPGYPSVCECSIQSNPHAMHLCTDRRTQVHTVYG